MVLDEAGVRTRRLFVYGTLQPHAGTRMASWIAARLVSARAASVPGRMHAIRGGDGWFPALVPAKGPSRVHGMLCSLHLEPGALARLDRYEGPEYRRVALPAYDPEAGRIELAEVYLWRIALPSGSPRIASGDFLAWLQQTRRQAFSTKRNGN